MTDPAPAPPPSEPERLEVLADRCELAMIDAIERALKADVGPVKTNARSAAAEYAIVAGTIRDRISRISPPPEREIKVAGLEPRQEITIEAHEGPVRIVDNLLPQSPIEAAQRAAPPAGKPRRK